MNPALIVFLILLASVGYLIWASTKRKEEMAGDSLPPAEAFTAPTVLPPAPTEVEPGEVIRGESGILSDGASKLGLHPGWYPDPDGSHETYYDGTQWTETRPRDPEAGEEPKLDGPAPQSYADERLSDELTPMEREALKEDPEA